MLLSTNSANIQINTTYNRQLSTAYLFGIPSLILTWEQTKNNLYMNVPPFYHWFFYFKVLIIIFFFFTDSEMNLKLSVAYQCRILEMVGYSISFAFILASLCILSSFRYGSVDKLRNAFRSVDKLRQAFGVSTTGPFVDFDLI